MCFIKHWEKLHHSGREEMMGPYRVAACLGLGSDHTQLLLLDNYGRTQLLDVATWKWMEIKVSDSIILKFCL